MSLTKQYNLLDLFSIQQYLDYRVSDLGKRFKYYKSLLLLRDKDIRKEVTDSLAWNTISQSILRYNLLSKPGCYSKTFDSCVIIDDETYDASITETLMGRVGPKIRVKVCTTYTIDEEETTTCEYQLRDTYLINNCIVNYLNLDELINNIQEFANPVN